MPDTPSDIRTERFAFVALGGLLALAAMARMYHLDIAGLWADELWGLRDATSQGWFEMVYRIYTYDGHPPGYHLLLRLVTSLFGQSELALRLPSVLAGVLVVFSIYVIGRRFLTVQSALLAAALVAFSFPGILYSQEARSNMLLALTSILFVKALLDVVIGQARTVQSGIAIAFLGAVCIWLHYAGVVLVGCGVLILLTWAAWPWQKAKLLFAAGVIFCILALYGPWLPGFIHHLMWDSGEQWIEPDASALWLSLRFLMGPNAVAAAIIAALVMAAPALAWFSKDDNDRSHFKVVVVLLVMAILPVVIFFVKSMVSFSVYNHRNFIASMPMLALLASYSLGAVFYQGLTGWRSRVLFAVFLALVSWLQIWQVLHTEKYRLYSESDKHDFRGAVDVLVHRNINLDKTAIVSSHDFFDYYLSRQGVRSVAHHYFILSQNLGLLDLYLQNRGFSDFYYMAIVEDDRKKAPEAVQALQSRYQAKCVARLAWVDVWYFSAVERADPQLDVPVCQMQAGRM